MKLFNMTNCKLIAGFTLIAVFGQVNAEIPEPQVTLYGKVFNRFQGVETRVTSGALKWQIKSQTNANQTFTYSAQLQPLANGSYDYRLDIPQRLLEQAITPALANQVSDNQSIVVGQSVETYIHNLISVDNIKARIVDADLTQVNLSQELRSQHVEVDLYLSKPPTDTDNDGLPDNWEFTFFGDITSADATADEDEDGLSNLEEYQLSSDPRAETGDNRIPTLINGELVISEQGTSLFKPNILDSDTWDSNIEVSIVAIDAALELTYLAGGSLDFTQQTKMSAGDKLKLSDLLTGHLLMKHVPSSTHAQQAKLDKLAVQLVIDDKDNAPVSLEINIQPIRPVDNNSISMQMWFDGSVDKTLFNSYYSPDQEYTEDTDEEWFGRAGRSDIDLMHHIDNTGWVWKQVATANNGPLGQQTIELDGQHYYESWVEEEELGEIPFHFNPDLAYFAVFKSNSHAEQILTHDTTAEIGITANDDPVYPKRLRFSREGHETLYGSRSVNNTWGISALFSNSLSTQLELDGQMAGYAITQPKTDSSQEDPSDIEWGTSRTIGGKMVGSANNQNYKMQSPFNGSLGEIMMFNCGDCQAEKWQIYGYLYSKWFGYVVVDHSQTTYSVDARSASASYIGAPDTEDEYESLDEALYYTGDRLGTHLTDGQAAYKDNYGKDRNYIFIGGSAHNKFVGGSEGDILVSGGGSDWLTGLGGKDIFVVSNGAVVIDFKAEEDVIDLSLLLDIQDPNLALNKYLKFETDIYDTYLTVDANGDGSGFTDATVILGNVSVRNGDLSRLWSIGAIQAGTARPELTLAFEPVESNELEEKNQIAQEFVLTSTGSPLPVGLFLPVAMTGSAVLGQDYQLEIAKMPVDEDSEISWQALTNSGIPLDVTPGTHSVKLRVNPIKDNIQERRETIKLELMPLESYDLGELKQLEFSLSDGLPSIAIEAENTSIIEGVNEVSIVSLTREGSLDVPLKVKLDIVGSAENGVDYGFISQEVTFSAGEPRVSFEVLAYSDDKTESTEFIELALTSTLDYDIEENSSIKIAIFENGDLVDSDGDGMDDMWEIENGLDFNKNDTLGDNDGDGLANIREYELGLDPNRTDTDGDGVPDKLDLSPNDASNSGQIVQVGQQKVYLSMTSLSVMSGDKLSLPIYSSAQLDSGIAATGLDGIGIRIHFNSQVFKFTGFSNLYQQDHVYSSSIAKQDFNDFDSNEKTDSYVEVRWTNLENNWQMPSSSLANLHLEVLSQPNNQQIDFSASQLSIGYGLAKQVVDLMPLNVDPLDVDNDGQASNEKESLALMRYLSGLRGQAVNQGITSNDLDSELNKLIEYLDVDADGKVNALTDGLLISRCVAGYQGEALTKGIIFNYSGRQSPEIIQQYCRQLTE
ncbi:type I secretion C-terminal target domain-containing protein [Catenovulum maritimum]|uniref:Calx-beta domain-containing protein n=1 Tax=Catenovulum maritimum TaxID=1513271 RepID=A0A0J8GNF9_9ALTE|nr:Calx-beta domain-containing protein [Catenovulum maritimum]KMT64330.1 hypothetical protein XM47_15165 [Catenovulum maritimum]